MVPLQEQEEESLVSVRQYPETVPESSVAVRVTGTVRLFEVAGREKEEMTGGVESAGAEGAMAPM